MVSCDRYCHQNGASVDYDPCCRQLSNQVPLAGKARAARTVPRHPASLHLSRAGHRQEDHHGARVHHCRCAVQSRRNTEGYHLSSEDPCFNLFPPGSALFNNFLYAKPVASTCFLLRTEVFPVSIKLKFLKSTKIIFKNIFIYLSYL